MMRLQLHILEMVEEEWDPEGATATFPISLLYEMLRDRRLTVHIFEAVLREHRERLRLRAQRLGLRDQDAEQPDAGPAV